MRKSPVGAASGDFLLRAGGATAPRHLKRCHVALTRQRLAFPRGHFILPGGPAKDSAAGASRMPHPTTQGSEGNHGPPYRVSAWPGPIPWGCRVGYLSSIQVVSIWPPGARSGGQKGMECFLISLRSASLRPRLGPGWRWTGEPGWWRWRQPQWPAPQPRPWPFGRRGGSARHR